ncbi:ABC transporter permease [Roseibium sp. SCP14]|uniref:ABC transporter permease n=1 Tax=Roseibium sp. SCP14 TaxID=3141375 RepID=UPI0033357D3A
MTRDLPQRLLTTLVYVFLFMPIIMVVVMSLNASRYSVFPVPEWSFVWYEKALEDETIGAALKNSLVIALVSAVLATIIGTTVSIALVRFRFRFQNLVRSAFMSPLIFPEMILAVMLLILSASLNLQGGFWIVVAGHVLVGLPFVITVVSARLHGFDSSLEEAAQDLGANEWATFRRITMPLALPGIIGGGLLAFTTSFDNFIITYLVAGSDVVTIPIKIYSMIRLEFSPKLHAFSTAIVFMTLCLLFLYRMVLRRQASY